MTLTQKQAINTQNPNNWLVDIIKKVHAQTIAFASSVKVLDFYAAKHDAQ
jgi:hypothetical protein